MKEFSLVLKNSGAWNVPYSASKVEFRWFGLAPALMIVVIASGFINLVPMPGLYLATLTIDVIVAFMAWSYLIEVARRGGGMLVETWVIAFFALTLTCGVLLLDGQEGFFLKLTTIRAQVLYGFVAVFVSTMLQRIQVLSLIRLVGNLGVMSAAFGIVQFILRNQLPQWLLFSKDTDLFGYWGTDLTRSTALLGNTIVYSTLMLMFFAIACSRLVYLRSMGNCLRATLFLFAVLVSFSRIAIAGVCVIALFSLFVAIMRKGVLRGLTRALAICVLGALGWLIIRFYTPAVSWFEGSFIVRSLFGGQNASVQDSNAIHASFWIRASEIVGSSPWFGLGLGSQTPGSHLAKSTMIIWDGASLKLFAEGGIIFAGMYGLMLLIVMITLYRSWRSSSQGRDLALGLLMFSLFEFLGASFFNTGFFGKAPFLVFWILFGSTVALRSTESRADRREVSSSVGSSFVAR